MTFHPSPRRQAPGGTAPVSRIPDERLARIFNDRGMRRAIEARLNIAAWAVVIFAVQMLRAVFS